MAVFKPSLIYQMIAIFVLIQQSMMCHSVSSNSKFKSRSERSAALRHSHFSVGVPYYRQKFDPEPEMAVDLDDTTYFGRHGKPQHRFYREGQLMAPQIQFKVPDFELRTDGVDDDKENEVRDGLVERDVNSLENESKTITTENSGIEPPYKTEKETVFVDEDNIFQSAN